MFKCSARTFLVAGLVLAGGLFATQSAQAQGFSLSFGNAPVYGGGYPGYVGGYGYNPYVAGYRGPVYNPYVTGYRGGYGPGYFPYNSYRANYAPYVRPYGYPGCW